MFFAHSTSDTTQANWQALRRHLLQVEDLARSRGQRIGIGEAAAAAGLLHDLGKYTRAFQERLTGSRVRAEHSLAGASYVMDHRDERRGPLFDVIAHAIAGHHAGLPDRRGSTAGLDERLKDLNRAQLDPIWVHDIEPVLPSSLSPLHPAPFAKPGLRFALLGRMIFSCLVDADYRDTEAFYDHIEGRPRDRAQPLLSDLLPDLIRSFDERIAALVAEKRSAGTFRPLDELRADILSAVLARAGDKPGLFTLTVPTGGGKTLASLGFAFRHAAAHGLDRIIYACPYTSIIDQTVDVFRSVVGKDNVLEHHSAIDEERFERREARDKVKLAMEDWSAPVIATTNVQLFESLFAARPSRCRKLHNIARSVIILDEAQNVPRHLLAPTYMALEALAKDWGCTVVMCTATQPALVRDDDAKPHPAALPLAGRELAADPTGLAKQLERTTLRFAGPMSDDQLVEALRATAQGLVIVNGRDHALALYEAAHERKLDGLVHLTTRQCAVDRRALLAGIRDNLRAGRLCRVVATSLVEAGVDLDFPRVWRAAAGLDQIAQAAGRCNREGRRPVDESIVTVFEAPDHPAPKEIRDLADDAMRAIRRLQAAHTDLLAPAALRAYFEEVYWRLGDDLDRHRIALGRNPLLNMAPSGDTDFAFRTVADKFRMIEDGLEPVIVPIDATAREAIKQLAATAIPSGVLARNLQPYTVPVPPPARRRLIENGHVAFAAPDLRGDQFAVLMTGSLYTREIGLRWDDADYLPTEALTI
ncbi:MAG: CRISPR-associated endonuclease Cas3'' [Pseudomonadota bacterium]